MTTLWRISEVIRSMVNPNQFDDDDDDVQLYTQGGWPEGFYGDDDPGMDPSWMDLPTHLHNEMVRDFPRGDRTLEEFTPEEHSAQLEAEAPAWLANWSARCLEQWQHHAALSRTAYAAARARAENKS